MVIFHCHVPGVVWEMTVFPWPSLLPSLGGLCLGGLGLRQRATKQRRGDGASTAGHDGSCTSAPTLAEVIAGGSFLGSFLRWEVELLIRNPYVWGWLVGWLWWYFLEGFKTYSIPKKNWVLVWGCFSWTETVFFFWDGWDEEVTVNRMNSQHNCHPKFGLG